MAFKIRTKTMNIHYKRGDVILIHYLDPNQHPKKRPALVLQADGLDTSLPQTIVAMITSNLERTGETRVSIDRNSPQGKQMGLATDSVVMLDHLSTVLDREIDKVIGTCPDMTAIEIALRKVLQL